MTASEMNDAYSQVLWEMRLLTWLQALVLVLVAAALIKYLFFR